MALSWTENTNFLINQLRKIDFFRTVWPYFHANPRRATHLSGTYLSSSQCLTDILLNCILLDTTPLIGVSLNSEIYFSEALPREVQYYSCCLVPMGTWLRLSSHNSAFFHTVLLGVFGMLGKYKGSMTSMLSSGAVPWERWVFHVSLEFPHQENLRIS